MSEASTETRPAALKAVESGPVAGPLRRRKPAPAPEPAAGEAATDRPAALKAVAPAAGPLRRRKPVPAPEPVRLEPAPMPEPARPRPRHRLMLASFAALVLLPLAATVVYLYTRAAPEYLSRTAFSIRSEEVGSAAAGLLGAITQIGSGSAADTDILYDFIRSQEIVERVHARLDLRAIYNRAPRDVVFSLGRDPSIEALLAHWRRMVTVNLETSEGILDVRTYAFEPEDARAIAREVLAESSALINQLSEQAREDALRYAREELAEAEANLRQVRQDLAGFRRDHRIVDPSGDVAGQAGLLNALQAELAKALVERDMLLSYADARDQRVIQADRRIEAIGKRIEAERNSLEIGGVTDALPEVVGAYEELRGDLEIAMTAYTHALAGLAAADAEARRQSRYLVPHVQPTLAETSLYPRRALIAGLVGLFLLLGWSVLMLIYYNVRDNR
jgi:capsular polysaccharide transport system permease protein